METLELKVSPFEGREFGNSEREENIESRIDEAVERAFQQYQQLQLVFYYKNKLNLEIVLEKVKAMQLPILNPAKINYLLQIIIQKSPAQQVQNSLTGILFSRLIQISYKKGCNDFLLTTKDMHINELGYRLKGTAKQPIQLMIYGNSGNNTGEYSKYCNYIILGNTSDFTGVESTHCNYIIQGNTGNFTGDDSKNCTFTIKGIIGYIYEPQSKNCTYKTPNPAIYSELQRIFAANTIQLIDAEGKILDETKK